MEDKLNQVLENTQEYKEYLKNTRTSYMNDIGDIMTRNGIPARFKEASIRHLSPVLASKLDGSKSYFITGGVGAGKSYMMTALIRDYLEKARIFKFVDSLGIHLRVEEKPFIFMTEYGMFQQIRDCYSRNANEDRLLKSITTTPLFAIDDFGTEPSKDWTSSKMFAILDSRYSNQKQTMITSNHSLQYIAEKVDDRIASRIAEMCTIIELKAGTDRRLKKVTKIKG